MPAIVDNAKGAPEEALCQIFVIANNGRRYQFPPTKRILLEGGVAFSALRRLHESVETCGLKSIAVEVVNEKDEVGL